MFTSKVAVFLGSVAVLAALPTNGFAQSDDPTVATHISLEDIEATLANAPTDRVSDQQIRHVSAGDHGYVGLGVLHRPIKAAGTPIGAIQHHNQTEMYVVLSGSGTLVTKSTMSNSRPLDPNGDTVRLLTGPSSSGVIEDGGQSRLIKPGDVVIIPANVAHGFSVITEPIDYLVFRVDPERLLELK
jgi:mannose-6-phosphate isomerase-like protein (cupin superfamily)